MTGPLVTREEQVHSYALAVYILLTIPVLPHTTPTAATLEEPHTLRQEGATDPVKSLGRKSRAWKT